MQFADRQLTCMDCSQPFIFTAGEQEFYDRKGFKEEPRRCKNCREARKTRRNGDFLSAAEGNGSVNASAHRGGAVAAGHGSHRGSDDDDTIGNRAPSRSPSSPSSLPPSLSSGTRGPREVRDVGELRGRGPREMFDATCVQCGAPTRVPFKPVAGRPVYCRDCYGAKRSPGN